MQYLFRHARHKPFWLCFVLLLISGIGHAEIELPSLGDASSAVISPEQERVLGQQWLRAFRARADLEDDHLLQEYVENILLSMVRYSRLEDRRLDVVIVDNNSLNAFAVPGGVIGVHTGLFNFADSEGEFASVMAHELTHLSQRHFARSVAASKANTIKSLAGLLAGVVLAATVGGDAGLAAITTAQAASLQSSLAYSRQNEQEADRIGMEVLVAAGYEPKDMARLFESLLQGSRLASTRVPEYLRTHPLTANRVNDALGRAQNYPARDYPDKPYYRLMKMRVEVKSASSATQAVQKMQAAFEKEPSTLNRYGLAMAYRQALKFEDARDMAMPMCETSSAADEEPLSMNAYVMMCADLMSLTGDADKSIPMIDERLRSFPNSYALRMTKVNALNQAAKFKEAADMLEVETRRRPNDSHVWFEYAETLGLAGEILQLHKARAEYFVLVGAYDRAIRQLQFAKKEASDNQIEQAILQEKISQIARLRANSSF